YIPFLPYVMSDFERFEDAVRDQSDAMQITGSSGPPVLGAMPLAPPYAEYAYPQSMARAIADDLRASGLFGRLSHRETADAAARPAVGGVGVSAAPAPRDRGRSARERLVRTRVVSRDSRPGGRRALRAHRRVARAAAAPPLHLVRARPGRRADLAPARADGT